MCWLSHGHSACVCLCLCVHVHSPLQTGYNSSYHKLTYTSVAVGYAKSHFHVSVRNWECVHMDCYHWQPEEHNYWSCTAWEPKFWIGTDHRKGVWWYKSNFPVLITTLFLFQWYYTGLQQLPNIEHWLYPHLQKKKKKSFGQELLTEVAQWFQCTLLGFIISRVKYNQHLQHNVSVQKIN